MPEGLDLLGSPDTVAGRRRFIERLDGFIREEQSDPLAGEVPLSKQFERGWFWGSEAFRERLVARIEKMGERKSRNYRSRSEGPAKDHGLRRAEEILAEGAKHFGFTGEELRQNRWGDWRRSAVAWAIAKETSVPQEWITGPGPTIDDALYHENVEQRRCAAEIIGWEVIMDALN
ncbi:MAG: hypothetical protein NWQ95_04440, partial [Verrucomicrobiales bacterium]|nr:hypothetical protein [Verrucomicrobiales bacterium]